MEQLNIKTEEDLERERNQKLMEFSEVWHQRHGPEEPMPITDEQRRRLLERWEGMKASHKAG